RVLLKEDPERLRRAIQNDVDIVVAGPPGIVQQGGSVLLEEAGNAVAQVIQGGAQRSPPLLPPSRPSGVAAAVAPPTLHSVRAAPGGVLDDLHLMRRRKFFQKLSVVDQADLGP